MIWDTFLWLFFVAVVVFALVRDWPCRYSRWHLLWALPSAASAIVLLLAALD